MDADSLERSALEGKDRDELVAIATALGSKPPARARKGAIIDLILELTGVTGAEDQAPASDEQAAETDTDTDTDTEPTETAAPSSGERPTEAPVAGGGGQGRGAQSSSESTEGKRGGGRRKGGDSSAGDASPGGDDAAASRGNRQPQQARDRGGDDNGGDNGDNGDGGGGDEQRRDDGPEPGNRRRRRRGRDRERADDGWQGEPVEVAGILDLREEGYGFLRLRGYLPSKEDVYVSVKQVRQFGLRRGDHVTGASRPASRNEKNPALLRIDRVNDREPDESSERTRFEDLTPLYPDERLRLEVTDDRYNMTARIIDLLAPIGKGQRGLIVSPPKAGKTSVMKQIVRSIETNDPECHVIVLLVDERPEEVTDFQRWMQRGEVVASTFDRPPEEHTAVAELVTERAKRMVEEGRDVVIVLDGITRLARAYNLAAPATGRIMSGGIDAGALYPPKKIFGAARNLEEGGSLTILATALVETNSKMDEHIFEEFKGTGNMELRLDRRLAERRVFPAIDVDASSTRHEELLFDRKQLQQVWKLRRVLSGLAAEGAAGAGLEMLVDRLGSYPTNDEFLTEIAKTPGA